MFQRVVTRVPMYDQDAVQPMRDELTAVGFQELLSAEEVDKAIKESQGTSLVVVNSVCGCAAGSARPGVGKALQNKTIPDHLYTVFAGQERDAVDRVRTEYLKDFPPSSPSMAIFKDGKVVSMIHRHDIEGRSPEQIAQKLTTLFEQHCSHPGPSIPAEQYAQVVHAVACGSSIPRFNQ
jgi:bacilliredoxin